jgi:hypothetical protein
MSRFTLSRDTEWDIGVLTGMILLATTSVIFPLYCNIQMLEKYIKIGYDRFLTHPFQSVKHSYKIAHAVKKASLHKLKVSEGKVVPVLLLTKHHAMKAYWGSGGTALLIL